MSPREFLLLKPLNLYGWSKQNFDLFVIEQCLEKRQPPQWAGLKFFNVYGPGEDHKMGQASVVFHAKSNFENRKIKTV